MPRVTLDPVAAQLVRVAQDASGLTAARERFFALIAPVIAQHGAGRIESEGDALVLITPEPEPDAAAEACDHDARTDVAVPFALCRHCRTPFPCSLRALCSQPAVAPV